MDKPNLLPLLKKRLLQSAVPLDRQIAAQLRGLIEKGKAPPHTRLPSIRKMADFWETNYSTVYDAIRTLVAEGLVVLSPAKGCFVAPPRRALRRICMYQHHLPETSLATQPFYAFLNLTLYRLLSKRGVAIIPYLDHRPYAKLHTMPPDLRKMAMDGEIDAILGMEIFPRHARWLLKLGIPAATQMLPQPERNISVDPARIADAVVELARKHKRRTIGFIHRPLKSPEDGPDLLGLALQDCARRHGISILLPEPRPQPKSMPWEEISAAICEEFLSAPTVPDLLFIYPDSFIGGVALTLVQHRIRVPEQILVVSHRNAEIKIYTPFPMIWLTVKIEDFAAALIEQIDRQIQDKPLRPATIAVEIESTLPKASR